MGTLPGHPAVFALASPRPVVAAEQHQRPRVELQRAQRIQHPRGAPIHFLDPVAVAAVVRFALKCLARMDRHVDGGVRKIEEEGAILVGHNELHRLLGVQFYQLVLPHRGLNHPLVVE